MGEVLHNWIGRAIIGAVLALAAAVGLYVVLATDLLEPSGSRLGEQFRYDLDKYRKVDPKLIIYEELADAKIKLDLAEPRGLAAGPEGKVYVVGDSDLKIFGAKPGEITSMRFTAEPRCLAAGADRNLYVGMRDHIQVMSPTGDLKAKWKNLGPRAVLTSIAVTGQNVYVADAGNRVILRYDKYGKLINRIGQKDPKRNVPGFVVPSPYFDLAVAADGLLRVANPGRHRIEGYTAEGDFELEPWGKAGTDIDKFCGCCNPVNFAILPGGGFVTAEKGLTRVKIYDQDGRFVGVVAGAEQFSRHDEICAGRGPTGKGCTSGGLDVAVDARGRILVLDPRTSEVRVFVRKKTRGAANE